MSAFTSPVVNRRALLRGGGLLAAAIAMPSFLAACSGDGAADTAAAAGTGSPPANRKKVLTIAVNADPASVDPMINNNPPECRYIWLTNERLLKYGENQEIQPSLAMALPAISEDGMTVTVTLRDSVVFINGKVLDSADVKFTFDTMMAEATGSPWRSSLADVASVAAPDPQTVVITMKKLSTYINDSLAAVPILPSNVPYDNQVYAQAPIGTGPFVLDKWTRGQQLQFSANPTYWGDKPVTEKLVFTIVPDKSAQLASLVSGEVDIIPEVRADVVETVESRGLTVYAADNVNGFVSVSMNWREGRRTRDLNLRSAIAWAVDRGRVVDQVFKGYGTPESTLPALGSAYYDPTLGSFFGSTPDLSKAQDFVSKAAVPVDQPFKVLVSSAATGALGALTIVQENLGAIGIELAIDQLDPAAFLTTYRAGDWDLMVGEGISLVPPTQGYLTYAKGSALNAAMIDDPTMNALALDVVAYNRSDPRAQEAVTAVQKAATEIVPLAMLCTYKTLHAMGKTVGGFAMYKAADYTGLAKAWSV